MSFMTDFTGPEGHYPEMTGFPGYRDELALNDGLGLQNSDFHEAVMDGPGNWPWHTITFKRRGGKGTPQVTPQATPQATPQVLILLEFCGAPRTRTEILKALGLSDREHLRKEYLVPLVATGWLAMTLPDRPNSSKQRYLTTDDGKKVLRKENTSRKRVR